MISQQAITRKLKLPVAEVWQAIRGIDRLDVWFPLLASCRVEGQGVGAVRYMTTIDGGEIVDVIESIDDVERRLVYRRPQSPFPVSAYRGTVEVFASFDGQAVVVWTIDFESEAEVAESVAAIVEEAIGAGIEGMERDLLCRSR